jgi:hypothetical protein
VTLEAEREGVGRTVALPDCGRNEGGSLIEPDPAIELLRQGAGGVMAPSFGFGPIDHADEPFEAWLPERPVKGGGDVGSQIQNEAGRPGVVAQPFIAVRPRRIDRLNLHRRIPVGGAGDSSRVGAEADQDRL